MRIFYLCTLLVVPFLVRGQADSARVFRLGEVTILANRLADSTRTLGISRIEAFNRVDASHALSLLPGVTLSAVGARNESTVYIRGFDLRQVPVFIDGIPVYVPYDGYVDLGRFTTFDVSEIQVSKGFTSVTFGSNTLGGAINLVSRRPQQKLEFDARAGIFSGTGRRLNLNLGSRIGRWYIQGSVSQLKQDTYPLSGDFEAKTLQAKGNRDNAYRDDRKYSLKVGFTPNTTDEYTLSYVNQQGSKGTPPYVGNDAKQTARFWQWPYWNKESWYFLSKTALSGSSYVKTRLYYDRFSNLLSAYDDNTYSTQKKGSSFNSYYDDDTYGGSAEYGNRLGSRNQYRISAHFKQDHHREHNQGEPVRTFVDDTYSIGLEDTYAFHPKWSVVPGISFNARNSIHAENYLSSTKEIVPFAGNNSTAWNGQIGLFFQPASTRRFSLTAARQSRFATIKDRYSYRMGAAIPNPDLKAERATHLEVAYDDRFLPWLKGSAHVFYSGINDVIQQVNNVQPNVYQLQNAGKAVFYGAELSVDATLGRVLTAGAQYTYLHRENRTNADLKFIDVPENKVITYLQGRFLKRFTAVANLEYNSERYSTSYGTKAGAFTLVNVKASAEIVRYVRVEGGVNNVFNRNYALQEGFPEPGRTFFVNLVLSNL
jgi:iron complex outermembrane receptor protein